MAKYSFALSDKLCKEYFLYKGQKAGFDKNVINMLLKYHSGTEFIFSVAQIEGVGADITESLRIGLRKSRLGIGRPEDLVNKTEYKLILTDDNSDYPYVNINRDNIDTCLTGCFLQKDNRAKAIEHLKTLCKDARKVTIYDKFLSENSSYLVLKDIIPNKKIDVCYVNTHLVEKCLTELKLTLNECNFTQIRDTDTQHHDRYIIIDDKIEIVLSSGFEHLKENKKEITYVVRNVEKNRLER